MVSSRAVGGQCCGVPDHGLADDEIDRDVAILAALANDTRYEVLHLLSAAGGEVCACNLVPHLDVNQSATSRALTALHRAGLVERRKEHRWRYYRTTSLAERLLAVLDEARED